NEILNKQYNQYSYLYVEIPSNKSDYTNTITLNGQYLVGYHVGLDQTIYETYQKMFNKIEELNLEIGQYVFEEYVFDSVIKNNEKEYYEDYDGNYLREPEMFICHSFIFRFGSEEKLVRVFM